MTAREICYSYRSARHKAQQIQILAELNAVDSLEIQATAASSPTERLTSMQRNILQVDKGKAPTVREYHRG